MPAPKPRPAKRWLRREDSRVLALCMVLGLVLIGGLLTIFGSGPSELRREAMAPAVADDDLTTGSIVFVPPVGDRCRAAVIDNATWRIRDNGFVNCESALLNGAGGSRMRWSSSRVDVIRQGFANR